MLNIAKKVIGKDDRVYIKKINDFTVFLIADGAGGMSGGSVASDLFISLSLDYISNAKNVISPYNLRELLFKIDSCIFNEHNAGETTGLIIVLAGNDIFGASVGDSEAWSFVKGEINILTNYQFRKPLLGTNLALPVMIDKLKFEDLLILGTDGLFDYIDKDKFRLVNSISDPENIASYLIENLKTNSGDFCDDVGLVIVKKS